MRITFTLRDYIADKYGLRDFKGNRSAFIEEMFILGCESKKVIENEKIC